MPSSTVLLVYDARVIRVISGVNRGEPLSDIDDLHLSDAYALDAEAAPMRLHLEADAAGRVQVADGSEAGRAGETVALSGTVSLMASDDHKMFDVVILTVGEGDEAEAFVVSPLPLRRFQEYVAISSETDAEAAGVILDQVTSASFVAGTRVMTADRKQVAVEDLAVGDLIQTRDHGVQPIRWIGRQMVRGDGLLAPIRIEEGAVQNFGPLSVSPMHRLFVFQRQDTLGTGRAEVMVTADQLVNGVTVTKSEGGYVDYVQLLFDRHEILYAEGIGVESAMAGRLFASVAPAPESVLGQSVEALRQAHLDSDYEDYSVPRARDRSKIDPGDLIASSRGQ